MKDNLSARERVWRTKDKYDLIIDAVRNLIPKEYFYYRIAIFPCKGQGDKLYVSAETKSGNYYRYVDLIPYEELGEEIERLEKFRQKIILERSN